MRIDLLPTPALLLELGKMESNLARMRSRVADLGVSFRPHLKTCKCVEIARKMCPTPSGPATVSTLREAEAFFASGIVDLLYGVGLAPDLLPRVASLRAQGCDLKLILDDPQACDALASFCRREQLRIPALIEIDSDGCRGGVPPDSAALQELAAGLGPDLLLGVMTHAGGSYGCKSPEEIAAFAEAERAAVVHAAERLESAGYPPGIVSVGSTPTALRAVRMDGVTEVRAGVYVFFDLVSEGLGLCTLDQIALSVLVTVIGRRKDQNRILTDGGWMALSRDRGSANQRLDRGYGLVRHADGRLEEGLIVTRANQEHLLLEGAGPIEWERFGVGTKLAILPNHACATAAQHQAYHLVDGSGLVTGRWERFGGW